MAIQTEKPQAIYIQIQDRRNKKNKTITVHGGTHEEVVAAISKAFAKTGNTEAKRGRR